MNRVNILKLVVFFALLSLISCNDLPEIDKMGEIETNVAYIEELRQTAQLRFTVNDEGGYTEITPRIANPTNEPVQIKLMIDKALLDAYNEKNNTSFEVLPNDVYSIQVFNDAGEVVEEGKEVTVKLAPQQYGQKVKINVKTMMQDVKDETTGEMIPTPLSYYSNYAIPVKVVDAEGVQVQSTANAGILFINRKFEMPVMHLDGRLGLIYKENTMPQTPDKFYDGDVKYPEWTCQYSFRLDRVNNNTGLLYPNLRTNSNSNLYNTLYGGRLTLFAGAGKVGLNQPGFEDFVFEAQKWYHMAIAFKDEGGRPVLRLFINGELAYKSIWPKKVDEWPIIFLGNNNFQGYVRELRFWSRALTAGEVNETLWFVNPESEGLEVYLPLSKDMEGIIPGKENDWINISEGTTHFNDKFTFPTED